MDTGPHLPGNIDKEQPGHITAAEIYHQPELWIDTFDRMHGEKWGNWVTGRGVLCGAGTSAYAAGAIQAAWSASRAIATTDLITDSRALQHADFLLSVARSGDSPESVAVVDMARRDFPALPQFAITCNPNGQLAQRSEVLMLLDPRTNDRSLVMTSSFSNLVLAGLALSDGDVLQGQLPEICSRVEHQLKALDAAAQEIAVFRPTRAVVLASAPLLPWAQEASLKLLEMTAGRVAAIPETYLGLRHGPMSFLDRETLVLCLISTDAQRRLYEADLINELHDKELGRVVCIAPPGFFCKGARATIAAMAAAIPDHLRTPFEIVFPQLLAFHLSLGLSLNPDSPSPTGIINRVVQGVTLH